MDNKNSTTPRVVRTGPKTKGRHSKKPASKGKRTVKAIVFTISKIILTTILVLTITGCIVGTALTIYVMEFVESEATIDINALKMNFTSSIYGIDENGGNVEVQSLRQGDNRIWVDLDEIPKYVRDAFVYSEDERFYTHNGVDFKRTFLAFGNELLRKLNLGRDKFGASTITQQLVKNINGDFEKEKRTISKKIEEIVQAMNLDRNVSKDQILELYLNYVGLHYASGVQAGAKYYFNKDVSELTYAEAAALAVTTKSPAALNPIANPEGNKKRRNEVALDKMLEFKTITQAEYDAAIKEDLVISRKSSTDGKDNPTPVKTKKQSYFVDAVIEEVITDLCKEFNYNREHAEQLLYTGGYQVYTTMETRTQSIVEKFFENEKTFAVKNVKSEDIPQAAMVLLDYDGNIRALVGGKGEKKIDRGFNRATQSARPSGSTIKPLAIYTPAFEKKLITWSSMMEDKPSKKVTDPITGVERDWPTNYDKKNAPVPIPIIDALKVSKNTIPVQLCTHLTPQVCFDYVYKELGLKSLVATGPNNNINEASMALGDGGVKLNELTAAFQIFGNGGYYTEPKMYTKVTDAEGKVILDTTTRSKKQVMSPQTAYIMNKGLWNVVNGGGSGRGAIIKNMETIGKTGTSNDRKDLLFMGCTPYYVAGIRYGHDDNKRTIADKLYTHIAVWQKIMTEVHKGKNPAEFNLSDEGVVEIEYCTESGKFAHSGCPKKLKGYYNVNDIPTECTTHVQQ